jgi:hypothetical protein
MKQTLRRIALIGLTGLSTVFGGLETKAQPPQVNGDVTYMFSNESRSEAQNSYAEVNYSAKLADSIKVSGAVDFYNSDAGYFGKTSVDTSLGNGLSLRVQGVHGNDPLTQVGAGLGYVLPTPNNTFAIVRCMPIFADTDGKQVDNKQTVGYYASVNLPANFNLWSFGEVNVNGTDGPQWSYGEVELSRKLWENLSIGANLQMNGQGPGRMTPELVPRIAVRANF